MAGRGLAFGDLNNDGWLDAVVTVLGGHPLILMNRGGNQHWLRLHFGLGDLNTESIEVSWPSGTRQTLKDVPADQFLELREPEHL